jgi:hypothetical protein
MSFSVKKFFNEYGAGALIVLVVVAYVISVFGNYVSSKGSTGFEFNQDMPSQYKTGNKGSVKPSSPLGQNEAFASASNMQTSMPGMPSSSSQKNIQNPSELLPNDVNGEWAQLNPSGKGQLENVNLLKAGYHIGIDSVGQSLRNANLQVRSEPPNPQVAVGPWNQTTMEPDFMRPPLEIGGN